MFMCFGNMNNLKLLLGKASGTSASFHMYYVHVPFMIKYYLLLSVLLTFRAGKR